MYELPSNFDFDVLNGCYLEMVSFGPSLTKLEFARPQNVPGEAYNVVFCVESKLSFSRNGVSGSRIFSDPDSCAPLISFLLSDVVNVSKIGVAGLRIDFEGNDYIEIEVDDESEFESYSIFLDNGDIVVV